MSDNTINNTNDMLLRVVNERVTQIWHSSGHCWQQSGFAIKETP